MTRQTALCSLGVLSTGFSLSRGDRAQIRLASKRRIKQKIIAEFYGTPVAVVRSIIRNKMGDDVEQDGRVFSVTNPLESDDESEDSHGVKQEENSGDLQRDIGTEGSSSTGDPVSHRGVETRSSRRAANVAPPKAASTNTGRDEGHARTPAPPGRRETSNVSRVSFVDPSNDTPSASVATRRGRKRIVHSTTPPETDHLAVSDDQDTRPTKAFRVDSELDIETAEVEILLGIWGSPPSDPSRPPSSSPDASTSTRSVLAKLQDRMRTQRMRQRQQTGEVEASDGAVKAFLDSVQLGSQHHEIFVAEGIKTCDDLSLLRAMNHETLEIVGEALMKRGFTKFEYLKVKSAIERSNAR
ncbi:hypothetical protein BV25DRAFT_142057 [Artomyces pyxidatus]|uniref:Uncharacterized protein n=1 Tax=Artomyces pyxidatus TaxID=48021 RepID=A0ACB8TA21_9AGAM|nr:hypothetical protein BV25DRAFT_142057 [Artomyces pyxidatus]